MNQDPLTHGDKLSECWRHIRKHYEERLDRLRAKNDTNLDDTATARIRGQIAEIKVLLSLGNDKPEPEPPDFRPDM